MHRLYVLPGSGEYHPLVGETPEGPARTMHLSVDDILAQAIERRKLEEGPAVEVDGVEAQEEGEGEEVDQTAASTLVVGYSGVIVV